jgi:hypothetical protein
VLRNQPGFQISNNHVPNRDLPQWIEVSILIEGFEQNVKSLELSFIPKVVVAASRDGLIPQPHFVVDERTHALEPSRRRHPLLAFCLTAFDTIDLS